MSRRAHEVLGPRTAETALEINDRCIEEANRPLSQDWVVSAIGALQWSRLTPSNSVDDMASCDSKC